MFLVILFTAGFLALLSVLLMACGVDRYTIGEEIKGTILDLVGLMLIMSLFVIGCWKGDEINDMRKSTWENRETFFWKDVDKGKIIEEWQTAQCSECGKWHTTPYMYSFTEYEYCPHCGSPMRTGGNDENK